MRRVGGPWRPARSLRVLGGVAVAASVVWSAPAAAAAPLSGAARSAVPSAAVPAAAGGGDESPGGCASIGLVGVDRRTGAVDQWAGGERSTPRKLTGVVPVAGGASGARLVAVDTAAGVLFTVGVDGKLRYYTRSPGTQRYTGGTVVGLGWEGVDQLVAGGRGVFYAVRPTGRVLWYRVVDGRWAPGSGTAIPLDASGYRALARGGDGVLYGVREGDDRLQRLTTASPTVPTAPWTTPADTGRTWRDPGILGAGGGVLLGVSASGEVRWHRQTGVAPDRPVWAGGSGTRVATGTARYAALAAVDEGCARYALPLDKSLLSRAAYGRPHHDYPALDLAVPVGTPVHVIREGRVASAGPSGRCGLGVVIQATDGGRYVYCHLSVISVTAGARVTTGSVLGLSGNTGRSTSPHLHVGLSSPTGTARCVQPLLLAVHDGTAAPAPGALPTSGCSYTGFRFPGGRPGPAPR